jgi:glutaminyl-tRNA synthetase
MTPPTNPPTAATNPDSTQNQRDFIREQVANDLQNGVVQRVITRFPPEPNGFLHIGHAKSICLNFGIATEFNGDCNLRFDDTNPVTEDGDYVRAIQEDIEWLGFKWTGEIQYASNRFEQLYEWAQLLIRKGLAYVDDQSAETISATRGAIGVPGVNSPFRDRSVEENLDLFARMRAGEFLDGERVLRAKIDMGHTNGQMRDPIMYRIRHAHHHRTGNEWCIYPTYDWAHGQCDAAEGITHSICTLEFDAHRPLYDWYLDKLELPAPLPHQYEFARLALTHTVMSKRKLLHLVREHAVSGWDDPRMPTIRGLRKRGYPAAAIRNFCTHVGVAKTNSVNEIELLESFVRNELNAISIRRLAVLRPIKVVITNWPDDHVEWVEAINNPEDPAAGSRQVPFSKVLYLESDDFMEVPAPKYFRLFPGNEVRLRYGYFVKCTDVMKDAAGNVTEVHVTYDPETKGGTAPDGRKVKTTLHWVSAAHAAQLTVNIYEHLFTEAHPEGVEGKDSLEFLNPASVTTLQAWGEPSLADVPAGTAVQFERLGYFTADTTAGEFHRTVGLKDEWARIQKRA